MKDVLLKTEERFYVCYGNHVDGPHPRSRILQWHEEGRLPDDVLLSRDGRTWSPVRWPRKAADGGVAGPRPGRA